MFGCFYGSRSKPAPVDETQPVDYKLNKDPILRADGVPLRLNMRERKAQRLVRGCMLASDYTDKVDSEALYKSGPAKRNPIIAKEIFNTLSGLVIGLDFEEGIKLQRERDFSIFDKSLPHVMECYRRYKIMNPDLLRTDYVKFLFMLQDAVSEQMIELLGFSMDRPVLTVKQYLTELGIPELLEDERLAVCITPVPKIKDRSLLNRALRFKDRSVDSLVKEYVRKTNKKAEVIELAIRSLNDATCFANDNVDSTAEMIDLLKLHFSPGQPKKREVDLSITEGAGGSRLTHQHTMQYTFVLQSLTLWKNISEEMFSLWIVAEDDMLNVVEHPYVFRSTGQGYHRVQPAPKLFARVSAVLDKTKKELGQWVGSEKIHMGDDQVPNAFNFIDKYAQISRIIIPILRTTASLEVLAEKDKDKKDYMKEVWGSVEEAQQAILVDFFRHGFDGSGGDNMEDAGSCIDGRLTSAWNWCNSIRTKSYYPLFLLAGFNNFDGDLTL